MRGEPHGYRRTEEERREERAEEGGESDSVEGDTPAKGRGGMIRNPQRDSVVTYKERE